MDVIVSAAGILLFIGAVFFVSAAMKRTSKWRDLARPARWFGVVFIVLLVAAVLAGGIDLFGPVNLLSR